MVGVGRESKLDAKKIRKICNKVKDMAVARIDSSAAPKVTWDNLLLEVNKLICADDLIQDKKSLMRNEQIKFAYAEAISMQRQHRFNLPMDAREMMSRDQLLDLVVKQDIEIDLLKKRLTQMSDNQYTKLLALATTPASSPQVLKFVKE